MYVQEAPVGAQSTSSTARSRLSSGSPRPESAPVSGAIAGPAAVVNAVADALRGAAVTQLRLTPNRVLDVLDA